MKLPSPCPWILLASICQARGSGPFLCFFGCIVSIGGWLSGVQRLDYDDHSRHRRHCRHHPRRRIILVIVMLALCLCCRIPVVVPRPPYLA